MMTDQLTYIVVHSLDLRFGMLLGVEIQLPFSNNCDIIDQSLSRVLLVLHRTVLHGGEYTKELVDTCLTN